VNAEDGVKSSSAFTDALCEVNAMIARSATKARRTLSGNERRDIKNFYIYILPWLIGFFVLTLYPMVRSLWLCFTDSDLSDKGKLIGFQNFIQAFAQDPLFLKVFCNTLWFVVLFVPASLILSFFIGWLLSQRIRGLGFFRTAFYIPYITAGVAVTIMMGWIFNSNYGLLNYLLSLVGIQGPQWLGDKNIAMVSIVIMCLWSIGNGILIMLAGIQDIPSTYYDSARIDGASTLRQIFTITIPLSTPTIYFNLVVGIIGAFQIFNQPYILTQGGPVDSTRTVAMYLYTNAFTYGKMGYGATIAWCLFIVIMFFTLIIQRSSKKWVFYDN
jgi:multiple sugar transport system permease protein